jgi:hypothetical protein
MAMAQRKTRHKSEIPEIRVSSNGKTGFMDGQAGPRSMEEKRRYTYPQAEGIIKKFGGAGELARIIQAINPDPQDHWHRSSIYRWTYPVEAGGTGGEIPARAIKTILKAARYAGIVLTADDFYPNIFK